MLSASFSRGITIDTSGRPADGSRFSASLIMLGTPRPSPWLQHPTHRTVCFRRAIGGVSRDYHQQDDRKQHKALDAHRP
jgi:hypothetical protein